MVGIFSLVQLFGPRPEVSELTIYSYSSFSASWGAGPIIKKKFEEQCRCKITLRDAEDSRLLIQRLKMEGAREGADVVIGLNHWDIMDAKESLQFHPFNWDRTILINSVVRDAEAEQLGLVPFDWGLLTINTRKNSAVAAVKNLDELLNKLPEKSLALQDPRTSAPGLTFLLWLVQALGEDQAFAYLEQLRTKIFSIAPGWSMSYGLFQKGQAKAVFSYVTSPLYHKIEEKDFNYLALPLEEGLPIHVEYSGVLSTCIHCERARQFVKFLLSPDIQEILMTKNYMLPVNKAVTAQGPWSGLIEEFQSLSPKKFTGEEKKRILGRWSQWLREH